MLTVQPNGKVCIAYALLQKFVTNCAARWHELHIRPKLANGMSVLGNNGAAADTRCALLVFRRETDSVCQIAIDPVADAKNADSDHDEADCGV
jgi:hypothetical protein